MHLKNSAVSDVPLLLIFLELRTEREVSYYLRPHYVKKSGKRKLKCTYDACSTIPSCSLKPGSEFGNFALCFHGPFTQTKAFSPASGSPSPQIAEGFDCSQGVTLFPADTTSLGTAGKTKSCQEWGTRLTWSVLPFPDVNECELLSGVCGEAFCENVEGSFLCVCVDENQEYSPMTGQCRSRASAGKWHCVGTEGFSQGPVPTQVWAKHSGSEEEITKYFGAMLFLEASMLFPSLPYQWN